MLKESKIKVGGGDSAGFNLDGILGELGSFGKYQLLLLLLLAFRDSFLTMCNFNYVFTAPDVPFRCVVPECEDIDSSFNASWSAYAVKNDTPRCMRLAPDVGSAGPNQTIASCSPASFQTDNLIPCDKNVYENYNSIVAEFDLGCEPWKRTLIGTVHNIGLTFSAVVSGLVSDRYGRKVIIVFTPLSVGVLGLVKSFVNSYWLLIALEFLEAALGYGNASLVLSLEAVSHKQRLTFTCISDILSTIGFAFFGLIAWKIPYWRHMMRAIYAPLLVVVFYIFLIDEGVRWLISHNKKDEAVRVLNKVAKFNNIKLSKKAQEMMSAISEQKFKVEEIDKESSVESTSLCSVIRSKTILVRMALIASSFVCSMFVFQGIIINSTSITGDKYINFSAVMLVSVPTRIISALTLTRFGRKTPICIAYCLCGVFFIGSAFAPHFLGWGSLLLYLAGKMCVSYGNFGIHVVAMEVFPTTSRNFLVSVANTFGRIGSVLAPQTPLLSSYMAGLPSIVFGVVSFLPAMLALLLPDTSRTILPDKIQEAENLNDQVVESEDKCERL